jgi:DNA-binding HxlR family transcriptional regulator
MTIPKFGGRDCHFVSEILSRIGKKWSVLVLLNLRKEPHRFNELKRVVDGISQQMLTRTLKALERDGMISRTVRPTVPPQVEYALTPLGHSLSEPVFQLDRWAWEHVDAILEQRRHYDDRLSVAIEA